MPNESQSAESATIFLRLENQLRQREIVEALERRIARELDDPTTSPEDVLRMTDALMSMREVEASMATQNGDDESEYS